MRTETRIVLAAQEIYIASDGTEFDDECACEGYEMRLVERQMLCFDSNFRRTTLSNCTYAIARTDNEAESLKVVSDYWGLSNRGLNKAGVYMYSERSDCWTNLSEVIENIEKVVQDER